jgi:hypothetical protein
LQQEQLDPWDSGSVGMDRLRQFLKTVKDQGIAQGHLLGLLHILIGRRLALADGTVVSQGLTWRALASELRQVRWDPEGVRDLGQDPAKLPPRDRQRFWYLAISQAGVDSDRARTDADALVPELRKLGYEVGAAPGA